MSVVIGNVIYRVAYRIPTESHLYVSSAGDPVRVDLKRFGQFDGVGVDGYFPLDNTLLSSEQEIDLVVYTASREMHRTWLRQQDPVTGLWSLDEICLFISAGTSRITIWVNNIFTDVAL